MSAKLSAAAAALQALSNPTRLAILAAVADRNQRRVPVVLVDLHFVRRNGSAEYRVIEHEIVV
jgi:hypothetical protein